MQSTIEPYTGSRVKLAVTISPEEMQKHYASVTQNLASQVDIKGFRKGKAPRAVLEQRFGAGHIDHQVLERAVALSYYDAVKEHDLHPVGQPETTLPDNHHKMEETGLSYTAMVPVMPDVKLGDYRSVKVKRVDSDYSDQLVEDTLEELRRSRAAYQEVDRPAQRGDRVEIDFTGTRKGVAVEGAQSENHPLVIGEDNFIPGFADNLVKLRKDDQKKFKIKFPKDYHETELAGAKVEFAVTMKKVEERRLPELTDDFAKQLGAESLAQLRERLAENLQAEKAAEAKRATEEAVVTAILAGSEFELPDVLVTDEAQRLVGELKHQVEAQGISWPQYLQHLGKTDDALRDERKTEAEKRVRTSLVLSRIAEEEKIAADKAAVERQVKESLAQTSSEQREQVNLEDYRRYVGRVLSNQKVLDTLVASATE